MADDRINILMKQALKVDFGKRVTYNSDVTPQEDARMREFELELEDSAKAHAEAIAGLQSLSAG